MEKNRQVADTSIDHLIPYVKKHVMNILYIISTLCAGIPFVYVEVNSSYPIICLILFFFLLWTAKFRNNSILLKYIMTYAAFTLYLFMVHFFCVEFTLFNHFSFNLILIFAYILPDVVSPIIAASGLTFLLYYYHSIGYEITGPFIILATLSSLCSIFSYVMRSLIRQRDKYYDLSIRDSLTGLLTLSYVIQEGERLLEQNRNISILIIDLNDFKRINDTYGHIIGNNIIIQFSKFLEKVHYGVEYNIGRLGGDEFVILLKECSEDRLEYIVTMLHQDIKQKQFLADKDLPPISIECSIGKALSIGKDDVNIQELLNIADKDMYYHKFQDKMQKAHIHLDKTELPDICITFLKSLEEKDMYTYIHSQYAAYYASLLARAINLPEKMTKEMYIAGWIHDLGKLILPNEILRKPTKLSDFEYNLIKKHVMMGLKVLEDVPLSEIIIRAISEHHERWDGKGYPKGLGGTNISLEGRIMQIADTFSAITIKRVYKLPLTTLEAIQELKKNSGTQFDPQLVEIFTNMILEQENTLIEL